VCKYEERKGRFKNQNKFKNKSPSAYPVAAKNANDSFSFCSNCGITNDWTGVGSGMCKSCVRVEHISVNNPSRFHANDCEEEEEEVDVFCFPAEESSGLFLGIRNGARDLDIADRSDDDELDDVDDDDDAATILLIV
jgi:hypothetical protein